MEDPDSPVESFRFSIVHSAVTKLCDFNSCCSHKLYLPAMPSTEPIVGEATACWVTMKLWLQYVPEEKKSIL